MNERFQQFLNTIPLAVIKCKLVTSSDGYIKDFIFIEANYCTEKITGIENKILINKSAVQLFPELKKSLFDWIKIFGEAAITYDDKMVEQYFEVFNKYLKIHVFSYEEGYFYLFIIDQTEKREIKKSILERDRQIEYLQNELKNKAIIDNLTNVYNHQFIIDNIKNEIDSFHENDTEFTMVLLDIDDFKKINNKYGKKQGDRVLKQIASAVSASIRKIDIVGRYGCDEFAVVLTNVDIDIAKIIVERIKNDINRLVDDLPGKKVTVSGAVLEYGGETIEEYIKNIEQKILKAKSLGQNIIMI